MSIQFGAVSLGLASELGLPLLGGLDPSVLSFPAFGDHQALRLSPKGIGTDPVTDYVLGLDVYIPQPTSSYVSLFQTESGDGELFLRDNGDGTAGLGISGVYDGAVAFDAWNRIVISVTQEGGSTILRKFVNGTAVGEQDLGATSRWSFDPSYGLKLFTDNDGETAAGAVSSVFLGLDVPAPGDLAGLVASVPTPQASGFFASAPSARAVELKFDQTDIAPSYGAAEVFLDGFGVQTPMAFNDSSIALPTQFGIEGPAGNPVPVLKYDSYAPNEGLLVTLPEGAGDLSSYTAVWDIRVDKLGGYQALLQTDIAQSGDGELFIRNDGGIGINGDYDGTIVPETWHRVAITVADQGNGSALLSKYLDGVLLDTQTVNSGRFTLSGSDGVLLLSDNDRETGTGYLAHFGLSSDVLDAAQIAAMGGADASGPFDVAANPAAAQIGFDDYQPSVDGGFAEVTLIDQAPEAPKTNALTDLLLKDDGTAVEIDLLAAFGVGATEFVVTAADGTIVDAQISDTTLSLSGTALGHSDITVTAKSASGAALEENFRAIVAGENAYVFAIMPDTQDYTSVPAISDTFGHMSDWLLAQKDSLNIQHMIHVGDIVQFGAPEQWEIAKEAIERLDGQLSYTLAVGNHDQQRPGFSSAFSFETDIDAYFTPEQVGATAEQGGGTYDGVDVGPDTFGNGDSYAGSIRNAYNTFETPDGTKWLVLSMEFGMPDDVLRWASEVIEDHLDHRVILNTHSWNGGDGRITPTTQALNTDNGGWGYGIRENPRNVNDGEDAWRELASKYPNVAFTFNGHNFNGGAETVVSYTDGDNPLFQMFVNYQNGAWLGQPGVGTNGGNGAMRLVVIDPDNDRMTTHTKLVELDTYFDAFPDHQEVFEDVQFGAPEQIALAKAGETEIITGDGISASVTLDPSATIGNTEGALYEWYTADGEKLGESDGAPLEVDLQTGTNRLVLKVTDQDGNVSTDKKVVIVEGAEPLLSETFDDGDLAGWGAPTSDVNGLVSLGTDLGLSLPSIDGVGQIPLRLRFDSSFRPYDAMTGEVMVSYDGGETFTSILTLDTDTVSGGQSSLDQANETITLDVLAPNSAETVQFAWRLSDGDNDWWWGIDNVEVLGPEVDVVSEAFWTEDFESRTPLLQSAADENIPDTLLGWTHEAPEGWTRTVDAPQGTTEWQGWSFATPEFWLAADGQSRDFFTKGEGVIAIADGDEWDDFNGGSVNGRDFNTALTTAAISLEGQGTDAGEVALRFSFDSSFRPYDFMTGEVLVSIDGGEFTSLLTLNTETVPGGANSLARGNETVNLDFMVPQGTQEVQFRFDYSDADNDWWWAFDNLSLAKIEHVSPVLLSETFDALPLQDTVDEADPGRPVWTPTPPDGWDQDVASTTSQGSTEFQGWTFMDRDFWISTAGNQQRDTFSLASGNIAIADPDEWDDANDGAAGNTDEFDSTLRTPLIDLTAIGGGQPGGSAAGVLQVPGLSPDEGILVEMPKSSGVLDSYSIIFDILLPTPGVTYSGLYQTDLTNGSDSEIYLRNDGTSASIGISGNYDGALKYGEWGRIALTFETDANGVQTLSKYLDGALLDTQVVDSDVSNGSRWSINADTGFLLFAEDQSFTSETFTNAIYFTEDVLTASQIAELGGVDVDGPMDASLGGNDFQLNFDTTLGGLDFGEATVAPLNLGGPDATSYLVKGSIFGNPNGEGEAALYQQSDGADEVLLWKGDGAAEWSNYVYDLVIEPADNDTVGAVFYYADADNHYRLLIDQQNDSRTLIKIADGVETVLAEETGGYRHFAEQDLRIAVQEGEITITLDDELLFGGVVTDAAPLAGGTIGVVTQSMDRVSFDNISVNPITLAARALTPELSDRWAADADGDGVGVFEVTAEASLSTAGIVSYDWLVDGAVVATGETAQLSLTPGQTQVTLRVTDANGAVSEDQMTLKLADHRAILAQDDFDGGTLDGWTIVDEGTIGGPSDWQVVNGALVQATDIRSDQQGTGSRAFSVEGDGPYLLRDGTYALWNDPEAMEWTNYALEATITPNDDDGIGVLFRYTDADNYYKMEVDAQTGLAMVTRHLDGRETILARGYQEYTPGVAQDWRIEVEDKVITPYIDGKAVFGSVIADRELPSGTVGLYGWGSENLTFDDVRVTQLDYEAPVLNLVLGTDGSDRLSGTDGDDLIQSGAGRLDVIAGLGGADVFDFSSSTANGTRETRRITDFSEDDTLLFGDGIEITRVREVRDNTYLYLSEDRDVIILEGVTEFDADAFA